MTATDVPAVERSAEITHAWLDDLAVELDRPWDRRYAFRVLRSFLHTLRDRMPVNETAQFAAQLPELLRGVYYENWRPSATPMRYDLDGFLDRLSEQAMLDRETGAAAAARACARVLVRHLATGELDKVRQVLPKDVSDFLSPERLASSAPSPAPSPPEPRHGQD
jgi:uncharacterized protein (DUF2267 family)